MLQQLCICLQRMPELELCYGFRSLFVVKIRMPRLCYDMKSRLET